MVSQDPEQTAAASVLVYDVPEAGALLGLSRDAAYAAARNGYLPVIRFGRRIKVPKVALDRLLLEATARASKPTA